MYSEPPSTAVSPRRPFAATTFPFPYALGTVLIRLHEISKATGYVLRDAIHRHHQVHKWEFAHLLHNRPSDNAMTTVTKHEERKPTRCNNIDGLLSIMDVDY